MPPPTVAPDTARTALFLLGIEHFPSEVKGARLAFRRNLVQALKDASLLEQVQSRAAHAEGGSVRRGEVADEMHRELLNTAFYEFKRSWTNVKACMEA